MTREWFTEEYINGKKYRIYHHEWTGYGGSTQRSSTMELIENENQKDTEKNIPHSEKEAAFGREEKRT